MARAVATKVRFIAPPLPRRRGCRTPFQAVVRHMRFSDTFAGLTCFSCGTPHDRDRLQTVCTKCGLPIRVDYHLRAFKPSSRPSLWRYDGALPVPADQAVTLSE